uniref:Proteasome inhibitor PI31 subunit n=1 Tax=Junco hyemalis TaxID=40217 RepID=A0A8C5NR72_JUNHY
MAGLEPLYAWARPAISRPQDALVCGIHWELIRHGYRCLGAGDQPGPDERKSELLPAGWEANKEVYTLRYKSMDDAYELLLKAIMVEDSMILNVMVSTHVASVGLNSCSKQWEQQHYPLSQQAAATHISVLIQQHPGAGNAPNGSPLVQGPTDPRALQVLQCLPWDSTYGHSCMQPSPLSPFAVGGEDLDPFGGRGGGMIVDPLRSGIPHPGIDPSSGIPGRLPPGAVPPGARFDPFGPVGVGRSGPDPDHLPPPGYDDMFM